MAPDAPIVDDSTPPSEIVVRAPRGDALWSPPTEVDSEPATGGDSILRDVVGADPAAPPQGPVLESAPTGSRETSGPPAPFRPDAIDL